MFAILENILRKPVAGLEVIVHADGSRTFNAALLKQKGSMVTSEKVLIGINSIDQLKEFIGNDMPVHLVLNGKGIIHKKVAITSGESDKALLNKVLPNADVNSFYIQQTASNNHQAFVSLIRKNTMDDLLEELKQQHLVVVSCSLGPFSIKNILPLMAEQEQLVFANHRFKLNASFIDEYEETENHETNNAGINIGNEKIDEAAIVSFAAAFSSFIPATDAFVDHCEIVKSQKEEWKEKRKFQLAGWSLLIATFSILLINYFVFDHFFQKQNKLTASMAINQDALVQYDQLKKEFTDKYEFLEKNGLLEVSKTSFYADQLALDLPASIRWTSLNIYPLQKKKNILEEEPLAFTNKIILISGTCKQSTSLNNWMKTIKNKSWIKELTLLNYTQDKANEAGVFSIEIKVK